MAFFKAFTLNYKPPETKHQIIPPPARTQWSRRVCPAEHTRLSLAGCVSESGQGFEPATLWDRADPSAGCCRCCCLAQQTPVRLSEAEPLSHKGAWNRRTYGSEWEVTSARTRGSVQQAKLHFYYYYYYYDIQEPHVCDDPWVLASSKANVSFSVCVLGGLLL